MIQIDEKKCIACLKCVKVCPFTVLEEKDGKPVRADKPCLKCMHCGAVCPRDAIFWDGASAVWKDEKKKELSPLLDLILHRRSYRHFEQRSVEQALIQEILEYTAWAPSAKNQHPVKWIAVRSRETIDEMMRGILDYVAETGLSPEVAAEYRRGNNVVMGEACTLILAYARENAVNPSQDTAIAMATAELIFQSRGVGTCWAGYLTRMLNGIPALKEMFPLPEGSRFYGAFMLGYPRNEVYAAIPERLKRAEIEWR